MCTFVNMKQIQYLLDHYQVSATQLADKLGIQRSTISHLLSGRNKPSLDILQRIIVEFPAINEAWLLTGHGNALKSSPSIEKDVNTVNEPSNDMFTSVSEKETPPFITTVNDEGPRPAYGTNVNKQKTESTSVNSNEIEQILVFYTDGTFKYFRPRE